ncbi:MAG: hypothetical protein LIO65_01610 [Odoribacter sp.]|nr:hypothetical protein [Odoribacter sp.]
MKKIVIIVFVVFACFSIQANTPVTIECRTDVESLKTLTLNRIHEGKNVQISTSSKTGEGYFGFKFIPSYEGFYTLNDGRGKRISSLS